MTWHISGSYLEACNCEAICPCRRIGGRAGGRSTYGMCMGALSWAIERGQAGEVDLAGQRVALVGRYDDDEARSPWDFFLYVDELRSTATPLEYEFRGRCGYEAQFAYASDDQR